MLRKGKWSRVKCLVLAVSAAGVPLITTATCNPRRGTLDIFRDTDYGRYGYWDIFVNDYGCYYYGCGYYDEIVVFD